MAIEQVKLLQVKLEDTDLLQCSMKEKLENLFQYFADELEIRVESLKVLIEKKQKWLIRKFSVKRIKNKIRKRLLRKASSSDVSVLSDELKRAKSSIAVCDNAVDKNISRDCVADIGYIAIHHEDISYQLMKNILQCTNYETIELQIEPYYFLVLPNGSLLTSNDKSFSLFNKNFKQIKCVSTIEGNSISRNFVSTSYSKKCIYVSYHNRDMIMMLDLELNLIKSSGSSGSGETNFNYPRGTCVYKDDLYVCDHYNRRIQVLSEELEFKRAPIQLNYKPWQIKIHNNTACVTQFGQKGVYFYDVPSFTLKHYYESHMGTISLLNSHFYLYLHERKIFVCYNESGELLDQFECSSLSYRENIGDGRIVYYCGKIIISMISLKRFFVFTSLN